MRKWFEIILLSILTYVSSYIISWIFYGLLLFVVQEFDTKTLNWLSNGFAIGFSIVFMFSFYYNNYHKYNNFKLFNYKKIYEHLIILKNKLKDFLRLYLILTIPFSIIFYLISIIFKIDVFLYSFLASYLFSLGVVLIMEIRKIFSFKIRT